MAGPSLTVNLPASANGGGTLNLGCEDWGVVGGEGVLSGVAGLGGDGARPGTGLLDGGGAGGGPLLLDDDAPVLSGVNRCAAGPLEGGGGGGGGARPWLT